MIASSTSSLKASDIQAQAHYPSRILVGHPLNPPHVVPMVELVAGKKTSETVKTQLVEGVVKKLKGQDRNTLTRRRDAALVELAQLKAKFGF